MKKLPTFEMFKKTMTNGAGRPERRFIEQYGNISFEEAYPLYISDLSKYFGQQDKINAFEQFLIAKGVERTQSNISESRYYHYEGVKYRFSSHVYPTGSMSDNTLKTIDFAADPEMIDTINF